MKNLKKIIGIFIVLSFICFNYSFADTGVVNTPAARIREKADKNSEVITKAYEDEKVEIIGEEGDWYQVKVNGKTGYVSKSLIKKSDSSKEDKKEEKVENTTANDNTVSKDEENKTETTNNVSTYKTEETEKTENDSTKSIINKDTILRVLPNFASNELRVLTKNAEVKIEKEVGNWAKISLADNSYGWVIKNSITYGNIEETAQIQEEPVAQEEPKAEEPKKEETTNTVNNTEEKAEPTNTNTEKTANSNSKSNTGKVNVETANVREKASKTSEIIERLDEGDEVTIVEEDGDWYKITSSKVSSGYVSKSLITKTSGEVTSRSLTEPRAEEAVKEETPKAESSSANGISVVEFAKQYLGTSYVLGGKTPESGFDCSGFTKYVFKNFGYTLGAVAADQASVGSVVERANLQPGDLILFQNEEKTKIGHVGIYIGNNEFIHAANPKRGVVIDNMNTMKYYDERFVTARRIVE